MGGCTTIGQSLMNIHSGGYTRLSSSVAAIFMLCIILAVSPLINLIPVAGLAGVMFVVTYFTIEWESAWVVLAALLPATYREKYGIETKVKRADVFIMLLVVAVTLIFDLAIAVGVGIIVSCLVYAWGSGTNLTFEREVSEEGDSVVYKIGGPIFFGSIKPFLDLFPDPKSEPKNVTVALENADIHDWSGMMAIKRLNDKFVNNDVKVVFKNLKVSTHRMLMKSKDMWENVEIYTTEDVGVMDPLVDKNPYSENVHL